MQSCCILGCESYKHTRTKNITYFKFPLNNEILLEKWLGQIDRPNWHPSDCDQICSAHFETANIDNHPKWKYPHLKSTAVPTIFPSKPTSLNPSLDINKEYVSKTCVQNIEDKTKLTHSQTITSAEMGQLININSPQKIAPTTKLRKILPKPTITVLQGVNNIVQNFNETTIGKSDVIILPKVNGVNNNTLNKMPNSYTGKKRPILKITINKKYNKVTNANKEQCKGQIKCMSNSQCNGARINGIHISNTNNQLNNSNVANTTQNFVTSTNPLVFNLVPVMYNNAIMHTNIESKVRLDNIIPKTTYTRKGNLSRENTHKHPSVEKLRYLYTKAQRDCDILKKRLKALRERHKQEQQEIRKLQMCLGVLDTDNKCGNEIPIADYNIKKASMIFQNSEEDEYEKLLREVRKMKQDILNSRESIIISHEKSLSRDGGEIVGEVYEDSNEIAIKVEEELMEFESENDNSYFEEEFLDPVIDE